MNFNKKQFKEFQNIYLGKDYFDFNNSLATPEKFLCYDFGTYILKHRNNLMIKSLCKILEREY